MTSTIKNRPDVARTTSTAAAAAAPATPAPDGSVADINDLAKPAAVYTPKLPPSAPAGTPFGPPRAVVYLDESKAKSPDERAAMHEENARRFDDYNGFYAAYLDRYTDAVKKAPTLEQALSYGPPAPYEPTMRMPVAQRAAFDHQLDPKLDNAVEPMKVLGERALKEAGIKLPGGYAYAEAKATILGSGVRVRTTTLEDEKTKVQVGMGMTNGLLKDGPAALAEEGLKEEAEHMAFDGGAVVWRDTSTGELEVAGEAKVGKENGMYAGAELDSAGKLTLSSGGRVGADGAEAFAGVTNSYDPENDQIEAGLEAGVKLHQLEVAGKAGLGYQLASKEYIKASIDPSSKGVFDPATLAAMRVHGN